MFMQSNGGLTSATYFRGKDSILSGPAGGVVGAAGTTAMAGFDKVIGFDMGGIHGCIPLCRNVRTLVRDPSRWRPVTLTHYACSHGGCWRRLLAAV